MKFKRTSILSILLCLVMLLSTVLVSCNSENAEAATPEEKIEVVRALEEIAEGTRITDAKVEMVSVCVSDLPEGTILNSADVVGKFATGRIYKGDYFFATKLSAKKPATVDGDTSADDGKINFKDAGYVLVSDYVTPNTGKDVTDAIQKLIDDNPNRTLYFPDGLYLISKPLTTSSDPDKTVSFKLSNFAQLKAMDGWTRGEPMLKLGATGKAGEKGDVGNCFVVEGGIFNAANVADAIWVMNGGSVSIRYSAIKCAVVGIHVKANENGEDPVVDVNTVNITGSGTLDSSGVILETDDNTLSNMRIASNQVCIKVLGNNNILRNLHPLYIFRQDLNVAETYKDSIAFYDGGTCNFYDNCYNDQFSTGFYLAKGNRSVFDCCFNYWYDEGYDYHNGFVCEGQFNATIRQNDAEFDINAEGIECNFLLVGESGGTGIIDAVAYNDEKVSERDVTKDYLINAPIRH